MAWQLQEAKQRFSEVVRRALAEGPQTVTRHGEEVVVVVAARDFRQPSPDDGDFASFLLGAPDLDELDLERARRTPRSADLG